MIKDNQKNYIKKLISLQLKNNFKKKFFLKKIFSISFLITFFILLLTLINIQNKKNQIKIKASENKNLIIKELLKTKFNNKELQSLNSYILINNHIYNENPLIIGIYPYELKNLYKKLFFLQTNHEDFKNLFNDKIFIKYYLSEKTNELPIYNFCHLSTISNLINILGYEKEFLKLNPKNSSYTLPETIFQNYYTDKQRIYLTFKTGSIHIYDFLNILKKVINDLNKIDNNFTFKIEEEKNINSNFYLRKKEVEKTINFQENENKEIFYIIRATLNEYAFNPKSLYFKKGADHFLIIANSKKIDNKTYFFIIDSLGKTKFSNCDIKIDNKTIKKCYQGLGFSGWVDYFYFFPFYNTTEKHLSNINDLNLIDSSGIYNIIKIVKEKNNYQKLKQDY